MAQTLYDKLWDLHEVGQREDGTSLLYIDRHLIHEDPIIYHTEFLTYLFLT